MREIYKDEFATYNPITNIIYFLGAIILGMFFIHPVFVGVSIIIGLIYLFILKKKRALRELLFMLLMFVVISVINPVFNRLGATVLFRLFNRPVVTKIYLSAKTH